MNYREWSNDYKVQEDLIKTHLEGLKTELKDTVGDRRQVLNNRISTLYSIYLECKHIRMVLEERAERCDEIAGKYNLIQ